MRPTAKECEHFGVVPGEQAGSDSGSSRGSDSRDLRRIEDGEQAPMFRFEQHDAALVRMDPGARIARDHRDALV